jgi:hypothetical protein
MVSRSRVIEFSLSNMSRMASQFLVCTSNRGLLSGTAMLADGDGNATFF